MSSYYDSETWHVTQKHLKKLVELDEKLTHDAELPKENEEILNQIVPLYIKYRNIVKRLTMCHDQIIQIQKRNLIKEMLDYAIIRMLEYKREIVNITCSEYLWPDNFMVEMKLTPDDIALTTPAYYTSDRKVLLEQREKCIEDLIANANKPELEEEMKPEINEPELIRKVPFTSEIYIKSIEEESFAEESEFSKKETSIISVQNPENRKTIRQSIFQQIFGEKKELELDVEPTEEEIEKRKMAAIIIQKIWRGYQTRRSIERRLNQLEELLDMKIPGWKCRSILEKDIANLERKQNLQTLAVARNEEVKNEERDELVKYKKIYMEEDIEDELRNWYKDWYNKCGFYDNFPSAKDGGSILIATGQTLTPEEYLLEQTKKDEKKKPKKDVAKKDDKNLKKVKGMLESLSKSFSLKGLLEANHQYHRNWANHVDHDDRKERMDLIREDVCYQLQLDIRKDVDDFIRPELKKLNTALMKKLKKNKIKLPIPKSKKARRPRRQKKRKPKKDQLADYEVEDLFEQLVLANVIKKYPSARLRNWIGDLSYQNYEAQRESRDYHPRLGEITQLIMEYCVLPLGSKRTHQLAPLVRSVNISGLPHYGKRFLVHAICTETGATLFDLSPENLIGKFESKEEQKQLMNMVTKLSRFYAPSVLFVNDGHMPWFKKAPKQFKYAKKFAKILSKLVKGIKPGDQVLFVTTSSEPLNAKNGFVKIHDKFIVIPQTDYNTLYMFYKTLLTNYHEVNQHLDVSCLAKVSVGLPLELIRETIEKVLIPERRKSLKFKPLQQTEIFEHLLEYDIKNATKAFERIVKFEKRTPIGRKRARMIAEAKKKDDEKGRKIDKTKRNKKK